MACRTPRDRSCLSGAHARRVIASAPISSASVAPYDSARPGSNTSSGSCTTATSATTASTLSDVVPRDRDHVIRPCLLQPTLRVGVEAATIPDQDSRDDSARHRAIREQLAEPLSDMRTDRRGGLIKHGSASDHLDE